MPDDYSAMGGFNAIHDLGLSVPEDVSVVGYDGIAYSQLLSPRLTTYLQDTAKIGATAAKQLVALIESPQTTFKEVITVDGELIAGGSVAKVG
jgi:LacI family transcriptional regulator